MKIKYPLKLLQLILLSSFLTVVEPGLAKGIGGEGLSQYYLFPTSLSYHVSEQAEPYYPIDFRYIRSVNDVRYRDLYEVSCGHNPIGLRITRHNFKQRILANYPRVFQLVEKLDDCSARVRKIPTRPIFAPDLISAITKSDISKPPTSEINITSFDQMDFDNISKLNSIFYGRLRFGETLSLQHGHRTAKVFVILPGFTQSDRTFFSSAVGIFQEGFNVLAGTLPGHENFENLKVNNGEWLLYAEYLIRMARQYGDKVIVVGHSLGGNIAIKMAEMGLVDGLFLFQPLIELSKMNARLMYFGKILPGSTDKLIELIPQYKGLGKFKPLALNLDSQLDFARRSNQKLRIPTVVYIAENDEVVSAEATQNWVEHYAPQAQVIYHYNGHLYEPLQVQNETWNRLLELGD